MVFASYGVIVNWYYKFPTLQLVLLHVNAKVNHNKSFIHDHLICQSYEGEYFGDYLIVFKKIEACFCM